MHRPGNTTSAIALIAAAALGVSACGRGDADLVKGKTLFVDRCGACHTLARANTKGIQGPNLDHAFGQDRIDGMNSRTFEGVARHQIAYPRRGSIMPANLVKGSDADAVAAYVGYAAGKPGQDQGPLADAGKPKVTAKPIVAKAGKLLIDAVDGTAFDAIKAQATAGPITFEMDNKSALPHNIAIRGPVSAAGKIVPQGGKSILTATLTPGTYTFFCAVPGHEQAGMKGTLIVK